MKANNSLPKPEVLRMELVNCSPAEAHFLKGIVALFADDKLAAMRADFQRGTFCIRWAPNGSLRMSPYLSDN
jgi:hypothetical protein